MNAPPADLDEPEVRGGMGVVGWEGEGVKTVLLSPKSVLIPIVLGQKKDWDTES